MATPTIKEIASSGFHVGRYKDWRSDATVKAAMDDGTLITTANSGIPIELLTFFEPKIVEILTQRRASTAVYAERRVGDRTTPVFKVPVGEFTGSVSPYNDFTANGSAGVNFNWQKRDNFLFETVIKYGELENAETAVAKINLASKKQESAARTLEIAHNKFYLYGVEGLNTYGILNDPSLNSPLTPPTNAKSTTLWADSTAIEIYDSIIGMFVDLQTNSGGNVDQSMALKLVVSNTTNGRLATATAQYGKTVIEMLKAYFTNLEIVVVPEYATTSGNLVALIAPDVQGQATGECVFSEKLRAHQIIPSLSSFAQKFSAGTFGAVIYRPVMVTTMLGV